MPAITHPEIPGTLTLTLGDVVDLEYTEADAAPWDIGHAARWTESQCPFDPHDEDAARRWAAAQGWFGAQHVHTAYQVTARRLLREAHRLDDLLVAFQREVQATAGIPVTEAKAPDSFRRYATLVKAGLELNQQHAIVRLLLQDQETLLAKIRALGTPDLPTLLAATLQSPLPAP